jgi:hypothetical protein
MKKMKKITLRILLLVTAISFGQTKNEKLIDQKIGKINFLYDKSTELETKEIRYLLYLGFQNEKYKSITDIKSVAFNDKESITQFIKDLNTAKTQMQSKEKIDLKWNRKRYNLALYDFSTALYLQKSSDSDAYTTLTLKDVEKLITTLLKIDFGNDTLLN